MGRVDVVEQKVEQKVEQDVLNADNICLTLCGATLLHGVNLRLKPGSVTVIMGPNGTGKTSLLRVLSGDLAPDSGSIYFNGRGLDSWQPRVRARMMAVLPQGSDLNFPFLVEEVVMLGRTAHCTGVARDKDIVSAALSLVDGEYLRHRVYTQLSGGEKQRVQLARVLSQIWEAEAAPAGAGKQAHRILILDEPSASFDLAHQQLLRDTIRHLSQQGLTVLLVLHDLNLAAHCADQIVMLSGGEIAAVGAPVEVMRADIINTVFDVEVDIVSHPGSGMPVVIPRACSL